MIRYAKLFIAFFLSALLAACGGGGGSPGTTTGSSGGGSGRSPTASVNDFAIYTDKAIIANTGTDKVLVTVVAVDAGRNIVSGATVLVSSDKNSIFTPSGDTTTDTTGSYSGTLTIGADKSNRVITVSASINGITKQVTVEVGSVSQTGTNTVPVADFALLSSKTSIANTGTDTAVITVVAVDANRNVVPGAAVAVSAGQNAIFTPGATPPLTNSTGIFTGTVSSGSDRTFRIITITVTVNGIVKQINLDVSAAVTPSTPGTSSTTSTVTPTVPVTDIVLFTDKSSMLNNGTDKVQLTVQALDTNRNVVSGAAVQVTTDQNSVFIPAGGTTTNTSGTYIGNLFIGADKSDRTITITVTINGIVRRTTVQVRGSLLTLQAQPSTLAVSQTGTISATLLDSSLNPIQNATVTLAGTLPGVAGRTITTAANGVGTVTFTAPTVTGTYTVSASGSGVSAADYQVSVVGTAGGADTAIIPAGVTPSLSASPNVLSVNSVNSTANRSTLRFLFVDGTNNPVRNVRVLFLDTTTGLPRVGSSITSGTQQLITDASGVVSAQYIAGQNPSPTSGVVIRACYKATDFVPADYNITTGACVGAGVSNVTVSLTVAGAALAVSIGDDNTMTKGSGTYIKRFAVTVADSAGRAVANAPVDISLDLTHYGKAQFWGAGTLASVPSSLVADGTTSVVVGTATVVHTWCYNEDVNRNGVVDPFENRDGSVDSNGQETLQPRRSDMIISYDNPTVTTTDASGILIIKVEYSQRFGGWLAYKVRITANVAGSQGLSERLFVTNVLQTDVANGSFLTPPYGTQGCTNPN